VRPLPGTERVESVLAFDFDGTLHDPASGAVLDTRFFEVMKDLREREHTRWGICTGRSLMQLIEGMSEVRAPFLPDFAVVREREIFYPGKLGRWLPDKKWNKRCDKEHRWVFRKARKALRRMKEHVEERTAARWVETSGDPAGVIASSVPEMDGILALAKEEVAKFPHLGYERNGVYLRFSHRDFTKGSALKYCGEMVGVKSEKILAVGDNTNDLSMLHREVAARMGCPSNSILEVKERITEHGGFVAQNPGCHGVLEVVGSYYDAK